MAFLERRILAVLDDLRSGRLLLNADSVELKAELESVKLLEGGGVSLATCGPALRALARSYALISAAHRTDAIPTPLPEASPPPPTAADVTKANREYFNVLAETFASITGETPAKFESRGENFYASVRHWGESIPRHGAARDRLITALNDSFGALRQVIASTNDTRTAGARTLPGAKMVIGGSQRFNGSTQAAVRSMLLYTDTVLIPDPVLPWLETPRTEERFKLPQTLEQIFYLLSLRPLVEADLPYPAICVFPSWEKSLELHDTATQDGIELLLLRVLSHHAKATFDDIQEIFDFAANKPDEFANIVSRGRLWIPPGGNGTEDFATALKAYKADAQQWRSADILKKLETLPDHVVATFAIMDRLGPHFHAMENANALSASPLYPMTVHWHYADLVAQADASFLEQSGTIRPETTSIMRGLLDPDHRWLGNVPVPALVELRKRLDNESFRRQLEGHIKDLGGSSEGTADEISRKVGRGLVRMLAEHDREIQKITEDYQKRHILTVVTSWITAGALFAALYPVGLPGAAVSLAKYAGDKWAERRSFSGQRRTLLGTLAAAAREPR